MSEERHPNTPAGILIDQLSIEVHAARSKGLKLWEEKLQLWIRPKPRWCPAWAYQALIKLLIIQHHTINTDVFNKMPKDHAAEERNKIMGATIDNARLFANPQMHVHHWTRRRDGRACACGKVEFGEFS